MTAKQPLSNSNFLIIGQGDIGLPVTNALAVQGRQVTGLARGDRQKYDLHQHANYLQRDALALSAEDLQPFSHIAVIVTPDQYSAENYKNTYFAIASHLANLADSLNQLQRMIFISSTGVYGQDNGQWIDESVEPQSPTRDASQYILQAEQVLQQAFADKTVIIRPSGIYGVSRLMRIFKARQDDKEVLTAPQWTNRIMDTDLVNIIVQVLNLDNPKPVYLATDYAPVTMLELMTWICQQLQTTAPTTTDNYDKQPITGKRLHSNIPLEWLTYPDWQAGYQMILQQQA